MKAVAEAAREVRRVRTDALAKTRGGLRAVYRLLELPGKNALREAHSALDDAVLHAYDFSPEKDLLTQVLALNLDVAIALGAGRGATRPGVPDNYSEPTELITTDCVRAEC